MKNILLPALVVTAIAFLSGFYLGKNQTGTVAGVVRSETAAELTLNPSQTPQLDFYVMSFCPYGNQIEEVLKPVADLLGDKVTLQPRYIFDKIEDLTSYCQIRSGDPAQCDQYIKNGYFTDTDQCKTAIAENLTACQDTSAYIEANNTYYASLHGRVEANQNVREICAYNTTDNKTKWWNFIDNVNKNCTAQNADTCWEDQANAADLDTQAIKDCFNNDAISLIEKEIEITDRLGVSGSPTLFINDVQFPPEAGYNQAGNGQTVIGDQIIEQSQYRSANGLKQAVCGAFTKAPKECQTDLPSANSAAPAADAGC